MARVRDESSGGRIVNTDARCTSNDALQALGYLRRSFTCFGLDEQAERSLLRSFGKFTSVEVMAALEALKSRQEHYPSPASIEQWITAQRRKVQRHRSAGPFLDDLTIKADLTDPSDVPAHVEELRERLKAKAVA